MIVGTPTTQDELKVSTGICQMNSWKAEQHVCRSAFCFVINEIPSSVSSLMKGDLEDNLNAPCFINQ
jgi:hypothetical protein